MSYRENVGFSTTKSISRKALEPEKKFEEKI
jgi:hypothetical protein